MAIATLCSITVKGSSRSDRTLVASIFGVLVPTNRDDKRVAPLLNSIELRGSKTSMVQLGKGMLDGRFPALETLTLPDNHANKRSMKFLIMAIGEGKVPNLREMRWDGLAQGDCTATNEILEAISRGKCPRMDELSFTNNVGFDQGSLSFLGRALQACPKLRVLKMDTTMKAHVPLRDLVKVLHAGDVPVLESLCVRLPSEVDAGIFCLIVKNVKALEEAAASRLGSLDLHLSAGEVSRGAFHN